MARPALFRRTSTLTVLPASIENDSEPMPTERTLFLPRLPLSVSRADKPSVPFAAASALAGDLYDCEREVLDGNVCGINLCLPDSGSSRDCASSEACTVSVCAGELEAAKFGSPE